MEKSQAPIPGGDPPPSFYLRPTDFSKNLKGASFAQVTTQHRILIFTIFFYKFLKVSFESVVEYRHL
jgi:hypothetical protein